MINHKASISIIIIMLLIQIFSQNLDINAISEDIKLCTQHTDKTSCSSVQLKSGYYQCCKVTSYFYGYSIPICSPQITPISEFND